MSESFILGEHYESYVQAQLASGRFKSASEVLQAALQLMEERDRHLDMLDSTIQHGLDDVAHDRLRASDTVFDELEARYDRLMKKRTE